MSHLSPERLAALSDEPPTASELAHLASCAASAHERRAHEQLRTLAASEQARIGLPLTRWESLAPALREDGVIDGGRGLRRRGGLAGRHAPRLAHPWLQAAAAVLLIAGGVAIGRVSTGASAVPLFGDDGHSTQAELAQLGTQRDSGVTFRSIEEAQQARARSELVYQSAALYLAEHDSSGYSPDTPAAMRRRLATLDRVGQAVSEALHDAPYDPVINGYYLTTLGQREATLRQLNTALPAGVRINSF